MTTSRAHVFWEVAVCECVGGCLGRSGEVLTVQPFTSDVGNSRPVPRLGSSFGL